MTLDEDIIPAETAQTLDGLFRERVRRTPDSVAYRGFDKASGEWVDSTWRGAVGGWRGS